MTSVLLRQLAAAALALLGCAPAAHGAWWLDARVVAVGDGDTITVLDASRTLHRVRLAGIDAPERGQPGGHRAKDSLSALVYEQPVRIEWYKHDAFNRVVGKVWVAPPDAPCRGATECPTTLDAGLAQIAGGRAWWFRRYAHEQSAGDREAYERVEREAREGRIGLWRDGGATAPWEWRERNRSR